MAEPISIQQLKDASLDVKSLEEVVNGDENVVVTTRLGETYPSIKSVLENTLTKFGFVIVDSFENGATLTQRNQALRHAAEGRLYQWGGSLPKLVAANSTPENSGGFGDNAWLEVSETVLRQELATDGGASTIGNGVSVFNNMTEFLAAESQIQDGSKVFLASLYQGLDLEGEGRLYIYSKSNPREVNQATTSGFLSRDFDGKVFIAEFGATGGDVSDRSSADADSHALQSAFDVIRANGGGALSMGLSCTYHLQGLIYANTSNLTWSVNNTHIVLGVVAIIWEAISFGYASYANVLVSGGTWVGDTTESIVAGGGVRGGSIIFSMCKIDNAVIRNAKFIECNYTHIMDSMGCRFVRFENNEVLGTPRGTLAYNEVLQLSACTTLSYGFPAKPENVQFFDGLPSSDVYCIGNKFIPYTKPETGITSYPSRPIGDHIGEANIKNIYFEKNIVENVMLQTRSGMNLSEVMNIIAYNVSVKDNTFISKGGRNPYLLKLRWHTNRYSEIEEFTPWYVIEDNTFIVDNPDTSINPPVGNIVLEFIPYNSGYYGDNSKMGFDLKFKNNIFKGNQGGIPEDSPKIPSALFLDTTITNYTVDISGNEFDLTGGYEYAIRQSRGDGGTRPKRDGGVVSITNNEFYGGLNGYTIEIAGSTTDTVGKGQETRIEGNVFHNQWKMFRAYPRATVVYTGNKHYNWRLTNANGDIGDNRAFRFDAIGDVIIYDNLVVLPKQKAEYTTTGLPRDFTTGIQSWVGLDAEGFYIKESASYKMTYPDGTEPE